MFAKTLFPTDFSQKTEHAFQVVEKLREAGTDEVIVLHCVDIRDIETMAEMEGFSSLQYENIRDEIRRNLKRKAGIKMASISKRLLGAGFKLEERLVIGIPFKEIIRIADKESVDAIVIGSTGKGLISEMLLGSTSERVIREAKCPVIIVK